MSEAKVRKVLVQIDDLRERAKTAIEMHTHWMATEDVLAVHSEVRVSRWRRYLGRSDRYAAETYTMPRAERDIFRDWLMGRARAWRAEADELSASLEGMGKKDG